MFNLSDKELDRLSREAADGYEVETNTSSWDALDKRLDAELGTAPKPHPAVPPPRRFIFPVAYTSLIILLVSSGYFLLKSGKKENTLNKTNYTSTALENKNTQDANASLAETKKTVDDKNRPASIDADQKANAASTDNNATDNDVAATDNNAKKEKAYLESQRANAEKELEGKEEKKLANSQAVHSAGSEKNLVADKTALASLNNKTNTFSHSITDKKGTGGSAYLKGSSTKKYGNKDFAKNNHSKTALQKEKEEIRSDDILNDNSSLVKQQHQGDLEEEMKYASLATTLRAGKNNRFNIDDSALRAERNHDGLIDLNKKNKSLYINRSLQIGLSFAPDFSKVKYVYENYHIGTSIGLTLSYQILHKFSVNSGLLYANKFYQADGNDFHQEQRVNAALVNEHIEFVRGSFKMLELPLNLRYDFSADGNTVFFVNAGLSSYFMLNENNAFFCHDYVGAQRWIKETDPQNQSYWFSMVNLSLGFETFLQKNVSLQIDPYVKLPMRGVGAGNMRLSSYGVNIGIKYSPVLKKSRR